MAMTVAALIKELEKFDKNLEVDIVSDMGPYEIHYIRHNEVWNTVELV